MRQSSSKLRSLFYSLTAATEVDRALWLDIARAVKGVGAILHSVRATRDTSDMLGRTLFCLEEKFVGAAPQVIPIDVGMAHQMRQQLGTACGDDVHDASRDVAHSERFGQSDRPAPPAAR